MRIDRVQIYQCSVELGVSYATHTLAVATSLLVKLEAAGEAGWGEVLLPVPQTLWPWAQRVAPLMLGEDAEALDALLDRLPADRPVLTVEQCGTYCHPDVDSVAEAFSIALHDLVARHRGVSLCEMLGVVGRWVIPAMPTVSLASPDAMAQAAAQWCSDGYRYIKIKLSGEAGIDAARVHAARAAIGPDIDVQVDANNVYPSMDQCGDLIDALNDCGVSVIEDLFDMGNIDACLAAKRKLSGRYTDPKNS